MYAAKIEATSPHSWDHCVKNSYFANTHLFLQKGHLSCAIYFVYFAYYTMKFISIVMINVSLNDEYDLPKKTYFLW